MSNATRGTRGNRDARRRIRIAPALLITAILLAGCESSSTDPTGLAGDVSVETAVQEVWSLLPSTLELEDESLTALEGGTATGEAALIMLDAGALAEEAELSDTDGARTDADVLAEAADTLATIGFFGTLSSSRVDGAMTDVETAMDELEDRLGSSADGEVRTRLSEAREALARARQARAGGNRAAALRHAAAASDALRWLRPEAKATAAVTRARAMLARAVRLAGDAPEPRIARALNAAEALCSAAERALDAELWRVAATEAYACARIARRVIVRLSIDIDPEVLAERAEAAIAHAGALFERAGEAAGETPGARVTELLGEAESLLARARVSFDEERFREAIGFANASAAHSLRVLRLLDQDGPSPLELRATAAVEAALRLGAAVAERIDESTPDAITEAAARTGGIVRDAQAAIEIEAWLRAWTTAQQAILLYTRILLALG